MPNIEMKATYPDLNRAREVAERLGGEFLWKDEQIDTYFSTKIGKLKLRQSRLNGTELLPYVKVDGKEGLKRSDYARIPISEPELVKDLFDQLLGTQIEIRKQREVYLIGNIRVHLDEVKGLGNFLEFEAVFSDDTPEVIAVENRKLAELMHQFGVTEETLLLGSYPDMTSAAKRGWAQKNPAL